MEVSTIFFRFGRGPFGKLSKVRFPITTACPVVNSLKCFRSAGRCQGNLLSLPIAKLSATAAIIETFDMIFNYLSTV